MKSKIRARPMVQSGLGVSIASSLSFISSLITAGILSFFVGALRRAYMSVPWPIILVMSASCLNITALVATAFLRCFFPSSIVLQLLFHFPIAVFWTVSIALLGHELSDHLIYACPSSDTFGHSLALVCHLFKALFAFATLSTACSHLLVILDVLTWRRLGKAGKYTAMAKNLGGTAEPTMGRNGKGNNKKNLGMLTGILRRRNMNKEEDERSIMMKDMNLGEKQSNMLKPDPSTTSSPTQQFPVPSPEWGPRDRVRVDDYPNQFAGQETRYDPGGRNF